MSITRNRELSQFGSFIYIDNTTESIGIATQSTPYVGIGTANPLVKLHVVGNTNIDGNLTITDGTIEASSYTLNGNPLTDAAIQYWTFGTGDVDIYRLQGNIGIGTSTLTQKLTIDGNISAGRFISTVAPGIAPFVVQSDAVVNNLNAFYLRDGVPGQDLNSYDIVTRGGTQTLSNKTLSSPTIVSIVNSGAKTVPTGIGTFVITGSTNTVTSGMIVSGAITNDKIFSSAGIAYSKLSLSNSILGSDISTSAGITYGKLNLSNSIVGSDIVNSAITNTKLQNSTISGISLGGALNSLTKGTYITFDSGTTYNGSAAKTIGVNATYLNNIDTIVARDSSGNFRGSNIDATSFSVGLTTVVDGSRNLTNIASFDSTVTSVWDTITVTATGKTLANRENCTVTASGQTITLPASPSPGWEVLIGVGNFTDTIVGRNGQNIMSLAENLTINSRNVSVNLIFIDATRGWRIV
jgi:hypothetical protein